MTSCTVHITGTALAVLMSSLASSTTDTTGILLGHEVTQRITETTDAATEATYGQTEIVIQGCVLVKDLLTGNGYEAMDMAWRRDGESCIIDCVMRAKRLHDKLGGGGILGYIHGVFEREIGYRALLWIVTASASAGLATHSYDYCFMRRESEENMRFLRLSSKVSNVDHNSLSEYSQGLHGISSAVNSSLEHKNAPLIQSSGVSAVEDAYQDIITRLLNASDDMQSQENDIHQLEDEIMALRSQLLR